MPSCHVCAPALVPIDKLKDEVHQRLLFRCEEDPATGCWIYTGAWNARTGTGVMRFCGRQWPVPRLALWVYRGGFALEDKRVVVRRKKCCTTPACFNPDHLYIKRPGRRRPVAVAAIAEAVQMELFPALQ